MPTASSQTISHYRLIEPIGRGAMGEVWLAEDTQLPRNVAIKLLAPERARDADAVERMLREAHAAASIDHPSVVTIHEAGVSEGRPFLVMQRLEGETLADRLRRGPLPIEDAVTLTCQVADALAEVHALGIVHRDLKPSNLMLTPRGVRILDFGIASLTGSERLTGGGMPVGTPMVMSPEQIRGAAPDGRTDLWSLGVVLYHALTGELPFRAAGIEALLYQILSVAPEPPRSLRPEISPELERIVLRLLEKDPAHRYPRAEDVVTDLRFLGTTREATDAHGLRPLPMASAVVRIAVLYFDVLSPEADDAFLAAGLTEDLIVDLTRVEGLRVSSRSEVLPERGRARPPRTIGRELGVDFLLLGSVRRAGNRARINAQLVHAADGHSLWADRFDRVLDDLFDMQAEVSRQIVEALRVTLRPGEPELLDRPPTSSPQGYALFLQARGLLDLETRDANHRAEELLRRSLELDPDFALGHATLGEAYALRGTLGWEGLESTDRAMACAARALQLDPGLLEAHRVRAMVHRLRNQPAELLAALERMITIDPDHPEALEWAARCYMVLGDVPRAAGILERLTERHPRRFVPPHYGSVCYEMLGRAGDARRLFEIALEREIEHVHRHPADPKARVLLASSLIRSGNAAAGVAQIDRALDLAPDDARTRYNAACAFARAGMPDRALAELRTAQPHLPEYVASWPLHDPDLVTLRDHPEFIRLFGKADA
jgi:TolB-like protein/tetratricopeptide (TPR) repeat protein